MVQIKHLPISVLIGFFVAVAFPSPLSAEDLSTPGRMVAPSCPGPYDPAVAKEVSLRFSQRVSGAPSVSGVRFGRHPDKTRVVIDLNGRAEFSYKIDKSGTMIMVDLPRVNWLAAPSSRRGMGSVMGYYFDKGENGAGRFGIATSVPVKVTSAFSLPPNGARGYRIVLDLAGPRDRLPIHSRPPRKPGRGELVSADKATMVTEANKHLQYTGATGADIFGTLTRQDKAIEPRIPFQTAPPFDPAKAPAAPPPPAVAVAKVEARRLREGPEQPVGGCFPFPYVSWWENKTHAQTIGYVNYRHNGDWRAYITKWENHLDKVTGVLADRKKALIKDSGVTLAGEDFVNYVAKIKQRISITRCLARNAGAEYSPLSQRR